MNEAIRWSLWHNQDREIEGTCCLLEKDWLMYWEAQLKGRLFWCCAMHTTLIVWMLWSNSLWDLHLPCFFICNILQKGFTCNFTRYKESTSVLGSQVVKESSIALQQCLFPRAVLHKLPELSLERDLFSCSFWKLSCPHSETNACGLPFRSAICEPKYSVLNYLGNWFSLTTKY